MLVIDDEPLIGSALVRALSGEHDVAAVTDARLALEMLDRGDRFDIVLCDLMMPAMSGMDLYARLCGSHADVAEQMVFMSGMALDAKVRAFVRSMANTLIEKPADIHELRALIRARLRRDVTRRSA